MDTLVSVGVLSAYGWSVGTLFFGEAGLGGVRHGLSLVPAPDLWGGTRTIYLEAAVAIVTAVLVGRWIEMRGRPKALAAGGPAPTRRRRPTRSCSSASVRCACRPRTSWSVTT